jgi:hypothetical protein
MTEYGRIHTDGSRSGGQPVIKTQHCPNCEATEQKLHDFRQKVSDAAEVYEEMGCPMAWEGFEQFIIPKPKPKSDPLVEIMEVLNGEWTPDEYANAIRAALDAAGFEIREKNDDQ